MSAGTVAVAQIDVPRGWDHVTPAWMTQALASRFPGVEVATVRLASIDDGTTSRTSAQLTYRDGEGPARVFVKAQGRLDHRLVLAAVRGLLPEARIFVSGEALPLEMPQVYGVGVNVRRADTIVVIEDVTQRGATPNIATAPLTVEQVGNGLDGLARLHARYWDMPLPHSLKFLRPWTLASGWTPLALTGVTWGVRNLRAAGQGHVLPVAVRDRSRLFRGFHRYSAMARCGVRTLLHGDAHVGNTYALPDGTIGFYDWQLVRTGAWFHDVGYFLVSALGVEDRRTHDRQLLTRYLESLRAAGVTTAPDAAAAWASYRQTPIYGLNIFLQTLALGDYQSDAVSATCIARFAAAFDDLDTADSGVLA